MIRIQPSDPIGSEAQCGLRHVEIDDTAALTGEDGDIRDRPKRRRHGKSAEDTIQHPCQTSCVDGSHHRDLQCLARDRGGM